MAIEIKDYSMLEVLEALDENDIKIKADGTYVDGNNVSHSLTVFDWNYFKRNILVNYRNRLITLWDKAETAFPELFTSWWGSRKELYLKQAYAYTLKYNPIENYSSTEIMTDDETVVEHGHTINTTPPGVTVTTTHPTKTDETTFPTEHRMETTPFNTTETTTYDNRQDTHATKGFNSTNFVDVDRDTKTGSETKAVTHPTVSTETMSETYTGKEKVEEKYTGDDIVETAYTEGTEENTGSDTTTRNYTLTKSGNIGVLTPSEMLSKEFAGLDQDLARRALDEFMDRYTYYCFEIY